MTNNTYQRAALLILDGWGHGKQVERSAIAQAATPVLDQVYAQNPWVELLTHGLEAGLPSGQMGNSEVGHLNLGAGRVVYQDLARINLCIEQDQLRANPVLQDFLNQAKTGNNRLHLLGLVSDGGVHAHIEHLKALCSLALEQGLEEIYIHAFSDGRDCSPDSGLGFMLDLEAFVQDKPQIKIASLIGRYYAMDRDKRWERTALAHQALTQGQGKIGHSPSQSLKEHYQQGISDEFIPPIIFETQGRIQDHDAVLCFNFRTDRCRQIVQSLSQENSPNNQALKNLKFATMTRYDANFKNISVLFEKEDLSQTLGEVLAQAGKTQLRMAETEKYPHVTFFFSGGREAAFSGEERLLCPSPKVPTYDLAPAMSAFELSQTLLQRLDDANKPLPDFICLNFANADMVGHTGVFKAAVQAAETVDTCLGQILPKLQALGYATIILADHGNSDYMFEDDGSPHTAHTTNPVPCILLNPLGLKLSSNLSTPYGKLADVAPTILSLLNIKIPELMTGQALWEPIN